MGLSWPWASQALISECFHVSHALVPGLVVALWHVASQALISELFESFRKIRKLRKLGKSKMNGLVVVLGHVASQPLITDPFEKIKKVENKKIKKIKKMEINGPGKGLELCGGLPLACIQQRIQEGKLPWAI